MTISVSSEVQQAKWRLLQSQTGTYVLAWLFMAKTSLILSFNLQTKLIMLRRPKMELLEPELLLALAHLLTRKIVENESVWFPTNQYLTFIFWSLFFRVPSRDQPAETWRETQRPIKWKTSCSKCAQESMKSERAETFHKGTSQEQPNLWPEDISTLFIKERNRGLLKLGQLPGDHIFQSKVAEIQNFPRQWRSLTQKTCKSASTFAQLL